MEQPLVRAARD